tara:strand:- start:178 stop:765 length:588 start_codon:yes stop_codon:yes gene_type:complete
MQQLKGLIEYQDVYVEKMFPQGHGFGVNTEGESVFFDPIFAKKHSLEEGSFQTFVVVPNAHEQRDRTPWRAVGSGANGTAPAPVQEPARRVMESDEVDRLVLDILSETHDDVNEDAWLCGEIAYELQEDHEVDGQMVSNSLHRLFNQGRVVKSITHQRPGLSARGSFVRWALTSAPFFPPTSKEVIDMEKSIEEG